MSLVHNFANDGAPAIVNIEQIYIAVINRTVADFNTSICKETNTIIVLSKGTSAKVSLYKTTNCISDLDDALGQLVAVYLRCNFRSALSATEKDLWCHFLTQKARQYPHQH